MYYNDTIVVSNTPDMPGCEQMFAICHGTSDMSGKIEHLWDTREIILLKIKFNFYSEIGF
jgi:hypothetical protein